MLGSKNVFFFLVLNALLKKYFSVWFMRASTRSQKHKQINRQYFIGMNNRTYQIVEIVLTAYMIVISSNFPFKTHVEMFLSMIKLKMAD